MTQGPLGSWTELGAACLPWAGEKGPSCREKSTPPPSGSSVSPLPELAEHALKPMVEHRRQEQDSGLGLFLPPSGQPSRRHGLCSVLSGLQAVNSLQAELYLT